MKNNWIDLDLRAMAESLRENVRNFGGFSPDQLRNAGRMSETAARIEILRAMQDEPKTGNEVLSAIATALPNGPKTSPGQVYPLLENLLDTKLISAEIKKDRRVFSLTKSGRAALDEGNSSASQPTSSDAGFLPNWIDLKGDVAKASARLASVLVEVSKHGTKDQQKKTAEALDEARRRIHEILSTD
jgi:DNA-binding PadR family transcriptional regulator